MFGSEILSIRGTNEQQTHDFEWPICPPRHERDEMLICGDYTPLILGNSQFVMYILAQHACATGGSSWNARAWVGGGGIVVQGRKLLGGDVGYGGKGPNLAVGMRVGTAHHCTFVLLKMRARWMIQ